MYLVFYFIAKPFVNLQKAGIFTWRSGHGHVRSFTSLGKSKLYRTELAYLFVLMAVRGSMMILLEGNLFRSTNITVCSSPVCALYSRYVIKVVNDIAAFDEDIQLNVTKLNLTIFNHPLL